ncbi:Fic family protein [Patescibacteria group bacterium]|nr:Fic family protein [Patescibacteria group bacterium]
MTLREKLKLILKLSGLTQSELAGRLGVTFAALNRWINGKSFPRPKAREKIDELYKEYSGEKQIPETLLEAKKKMVLKKRKEHSNVLKEIINNPDIRDQFYLSLTYHSNRIEGSTLSENETAAILFHNTALPNKSLVEQLEAKNHQAALEYLFRFLNKKKSPNEALILKLHGILMNAVRSDAGSYRNHGVRIVGAHVPTANYLKVPNLMKKLFLGINREPSDIIRQLADTHSRFEKIHPFADGNGRVGRLLIQAMALRANLAPPVILQEKKRLYISYLNKAQTKGDLSLLEDFLCDAIIEGYMVLEER